MPKGDRGAALYEDDDFYDEEDYYGMISDIKYPSDSFFLICNIFVRRILR